jgi:microcystin-dependent protein
MAIQQNTALFSLLGTTYGGNGTTNFALPNLMGALPIHIGRNQPGPGLSVYDLGETGGSTTVTILSEEMAAHSHSPVTTTATGTVVTSAGNQPAKAFSALCRGTPRACSTAASLRRPRSCRTRPSAPWAATSPTTT